MHDHRVPSGKFVALRTEPGFFFFVETDLYARYSFRPNSGIFGRPGSEFRAVPVIAVISNASSNEANRAALSNWAKTASSSGQRIWQQTDIFSAGFAHIISPLTQVRKVLSGEAIQPIVSAVGEISIVTGLKGASAASMNFDSRSIAPTRPLGPLQNDTITPTGHCPLRLPE